MTVADSPFITISMWVRAQNNGLNNLHTAPNLVSPGLGSNSIDLGGSLDGSQGDQDISCYFAATTLPGTHQVAFGSTSRPFTMNDTGHHVFISIDTNHPAGAKLLNVYIDAVNVKDNSITLDANVAFNIGFNGFKFGLPDTDDSIDIVEADLDYAEVWIAVGQYVDPSNISKFRDPVTGKPVNLGSNGQTPTGTSPTYYLKGPWQNFATNLGTGGAVTLVNVPASGGGFTAVAAIGDSTWVLTE
jgi:hypothetical protein